MIINNKYNHLHFNRECVQCRAFNKGEKKDTCAQECSHFNITKVENRDKLPQPGQVDPLSHCKEKDVDDCWFYFTYSVNGNNEATVHVVETPGRNLIISKFFAFSFISFCCLELLVVPLDPWVGKIPWRRERLPTPVFWPGEFDGRSMESQIVRHD